MRGREGRAAVTLWWRNKIKWVRRRGEGRERWQVEGTRGRGSEGGGEETFCVRATQFLELTQRCRRTATIAYFSWLQCVKLVKYFIFLNNYGKVRILIIRTSIIHNQDIAIKCENHQEPAGPPAGLFLDELWQEGEYEPIRGRVQRNKIPQQKKHQPLNINLPYGCERHVFRAYHWLRYRVPMVFRPYE